LYATAGNDYRALVEIVTSPEQLPPGKPPVTVEEDFPDPDIHITFSPSESDGSFFSNMKVDVPANTPPGAYEITITVTCHTQFDDFVFTVYVGTCPANSIDRGFAISGNGGGSPFPSECAAPSEEPSESPTASPTPSSTSSALDALWGDSDCSGGVDPIDSLKTLRTDGGLPVQQVPGCPAWNALVRFLTGLGSRIGVSGADTFPWGDADCSDAVDPVDSLKILRSDAGLTVEQPGGCPDIGAETAYELVEAS
jgi:hypothetical protein